MFADLERANQRAQAAERETAALQDQLIQLQADIRQEEPGRGSPLTTSGSGRYRNKTFFYVQMKKCSYFELGVQFTEF
jgi:hypothetical protein